MCGDMADCDQIEQLERANFRCGCGHGFKGRPERVAEIAGDPVHPWEYFARCGECGAEAGQAHWERNLLKAWAHATGPRTEAGKRISASNLDGHPTPEEARRTRFNAMKTGAFARTATYFPARPGKYPICEGCEYREEICPTQVACLKRTELFMQHHIAFDQGDPDVLVSLHADLQANVLALMQDMLRNVIAAGTELTHQAYYYDKDGGLHWVERLDPHTGEMVPVIEHLPHPLLKTLGDWLQKNGLSLDDLAMTRKGQEDRSIDMGYLDAEKESKEQMDDYARRAAEAVEGLRGMFERGQKKLREDPTYLEHQRDG